MKKTEHKANGLTFLSKVIAEPCKAPEKLKKKQKHGSKGLWQRIKSWLIGYTVDDINRLKEAGIQVVEASAAEKKADAFRKVAEAQKIHAESEGIRIENEIRRQLVGLKLEDNSISEDRQPKNKIQYQMDDSILENNNITKVRQSKAENRVLQAINEIKLNGGQVYFDKHQIET